MRAHRMPSRACLFLLFAVAFGWPLLAQQTDLSKSQMPSVITVPEEAKASDHFDVDVATNAYLAQIPAGSTDAQRRLFRRRLLADPVGFSHVGRNLLVPIAIWLVCTNAQSRRAYHSISAVTDVCVLDSVHGGHIYSGSSPGHIRRVFP